MVAAPQGVRGGGGGDKDESLNVSSGARGVEAMASAAAASITSAASKLLPPRRWSNATEEGDKLHAAEAAEAKDRDTTLPDDVSFLYDVAACVRDTLRVPLSGALFTAGWSQGGKLASGLACAPAPPNGTRGFNLSAIAVGEGLSAGNCTQAASIPMLMLQGGEDKLVPFCCDGVPYRAGSESLQSWAAPRGCADIQAGDGWRARCGGDGDGKGRAAPVHTGDMQRHQGGAHWAVLAPQAAA